MIFVINLDQLFLFLGQMTHAANNYVLPPDGSTIRDSDGIHRSKICNAVKARAKAKRKANTKRCHIKSKSIPPRMQNKRNNCLSWLGLAL